MYIYIILYKMYPMYTLQITTADPDAPRSVRPAKEHDPLGASPRCEGHFVKRRSAEVMRFGWF